MDENTSNEHDETSFDDEAVGSAAKHQEQQEQRVQTEERLSMDPSDMADAIDHEEDQKFNADPKPRYDDEVEEALPDDAR